MSADLELQKAIYERLAADAPLDELIGARLYDNVPGDTGFPYAVLGASETAEWGTGDSTGTEHRLAFQVYSRSGGRSEPKAIMDAIARALHGAELTLQTHCLVNLRLTGSDIQRESDGATWRGTIRFRAITEPNET